MDEQMDFKISNPENTRESEKIHSSIIEFNESKSVSHNVMDCENNDLDTESEFTADSRSTAIAEDDAMTLVSASDFGDDNFEDVPNDRIYEELIRIFPNEDRQYIKKICNIPPFDEVIKSDDVLLQMLVNHLIMLEEVRPFVESDIEEENLKFQKLPSDIKDDIIDEQSQILIGLFEDADPSYLRKYLKDNFDNENAIEQFIKMHMDKKDYPTRAQYNEEVQKRYLKSRYTFNFNVKNFLKVFPDPVEYFEDKCRICIYKPEGLKFLENIFKNTTENILGKYAQCNYNISLTAKFLEEKFGERKILLDVDEYPSDSVLLEEIAYIENKRIIIDTIQKNKEIRDKKFKGLKETNKLLECLCCYNEEIMPNEADQCSNWHIFCKPCIAKGAEIALGEGKFSVECFLVECTSEFPLAVLQNAMRPVLFSIFVQKYQQAQVDAAEIENLISCPFCHFSIILPLDERVFNCMNPQCLKKSCPKCKEVNHLPYKCGEKELIEKSAAGRRYVEEKMTQALVITCYFCKKEFIKDGGCNTMTCVCGASICYICKQPIKGGGHSTCHGGTEPGYEKRKVIAGARAAQAEVLQENPSLTIDITPLLP